MKTKQEIKNQKDQAKDPIIINLLKVILGEIDRLPTREEPTEEQIYSIIKKMHESAKIMSSYDDNAKVELNYLQQFIKSQLTDDQLEQIIGEAINNNLIHNIGEAMKFLKTNYPNQYDGKSASLIIKKLL
jgi:uncharacterized protein YqeY